MHSVGLPSKLGLKGNNMRSLLILLLVACFNGSALAQGFPWEIFEPRTLKEVTSLTTKAVRPDDSMFLSTTQLPSKMLVTFTGESRPIIKSRRAFISFWAGTFKQPADYSDRYQHEYLYKEGDEEYWLPTQEPVTKYFDRELKPGDKMTLYIITIGAYRAEKAIDCVILVEEFRTWAAQQ